jgi:hypothetical protein
MSKGETLYINMLTVPPDDSWREWLRVQARAGMTWEWEGQPIADQVKLTKVTNAPEVLPEWLERRRMT